MNLFSKKKGVIWEAINGIILLTGVGSIVAILAILFFMDLTSSSAGPYARAGIYGLLGAIALCYLTLFITNRKYNLLGPSYPVSRRLFNGLLILVTLGSTITSLMVFCMFVAKAIHGATVYGYDWLTVLSCFVPAIIAIAALFLSNIKPILISKNSKTLNVVNFFSLAACIGLTATIFDIIINIIQRTQSYATTPPTYDCFHDQHYYCDYSTTYAPNFSNDWKIVAFMFCIVIGLVILIYFLNFHKKRHLNNSLPKAFNDISKNSVPNDLKGGDKPKKN